MADTSPLYSTYVSGTYSGSTFTANNTGGGGNVQYAVRENGNVTQIKPGDSVELDYYSGGSEFGDAPGGTYIGYYSPDGGNTQYPFIQLNGEYLLIGQSKTGNYAITTSPYTKGNVDCFCTGSRIRVSRNGAEFDIAVENLAVGDLAVTASGARRPIRWIGHRRIDPRRQPKVREAMPVRIRAHAFGHGLPERDLFLSPGHPVLVGADEDERGGHLVPIMCLINGTTIERMPVVDVTYWHVELDAHDVLLAEGLAAESYFDLGSRLWFDGADGPLVDPDLTLPGIPGRCRPVAVDGPVVEAERCRLDMVFAARLGDACAWPDEAALAVG